jgi:hypothetical protein
MRGLWQPVRRVGPELIQVAARTRLQLIHIRRSRVRLNTYYDLEIDQFTAGEFPRQAKFGNAFTIMPDITFRYSVGAGGGPAAMGRPSPARTPASPAADAIGGSAAKG